MNKKIINNEDLSRLVDELILLSKLHRRLGQSLDFRETLLAAAYALKELSAANFVLLRLLDWQEAEIIHSLFIKNKPVWDKHFLLVRKENKIFEQLLKDRQNKIISKPLALEYDLSCQQTTFLLVKQPYGTVGFFTLGFKAKDGQEEIERLLRIAAEPIGASLLQAKFLWEQGNLNKEKIDYLAKVSHHARTPLTIIKGNTELLKKELKGRQRSCLLEIEKETDYLTKLFSNLLNLARLDLGGTNIYWGKFDLNKLIKDLQKKMKSLAGRRQVKFTLKNGPINFYGDKSRIEEMLLNLLENAVKYTDPKDGSIEMAVKKQKNKVVIEITNNGPGIAKQDLPYIFKPFYRANRQKYGSGLGLAIAKTIAQVHFGQIQAESQPEKTVFTIVLPVAK